jgi:hypothetical protein
VSQIGIKRADFLQKGQEDHVMRPLNQDVEQALPEDPNLAGNGTENAADEADIIADQDETLLASPQEADPNLGADGTENIGEDRAEFVRGEIDVKEAMDRAVREMSYANPPTGKH